MSTLGSVTRWLPLLAEGDEEAARVLFERFFSRIVGLARVRLNGVPRTVADEEDVALWAFHSFCRGLRQGRLTPPVNRDCLWALLARIARCKAARLARDLPPPHVVLDDQAAAGPGPEEAALMADTLDHFLAVLDGGLRPFAELHLAGLSRDAIADRIGVCRRTVGNKLQLIRQIWAREVDR